jgi:hypothetical protein
VEKKTYIAVRKFKALLADGRHPKHKIISILYYRTISTLKGQRRFSAASQAGYRYALVRALAKKQLFERLKLGLPTNKELVSRERQLQRYYIITLGH